MTTPVEADAGTGVKRSARAASALAASTFLILATCARKAPDSAEVDAAAATITADELREHLRTLASDSFAGRAPGSAGGQMAAEYIARAFQDAGLEPVSGSYYQPVPVIGVTPDPSSIALAFAREGWSWTPGYPEEYVLWAGAPDTTVEAEGELVFVGYGIHAPEYNWDDFGGEDLAGKILLVLVNDPPAPATEPELFGGRAMTYYGRWTYKFEEAERRGARGTLIVHTTEAAGYPWTVVRSSWSGEQFSLPRDPNAPPPLAFRGWVTDAAARRILEAAGLQLDELVTRAATRQFEPVPTGIRVAARITNTVRQIETANVVALLRGAERPDEVITVTSHYDHLGIGPAQDGDSIYNGAYDNASGIAVLIEVAEALASLQPPPARSILFIATTAEEAGLLGAHWYVQNPLFPLKKTVAELNVDGANLWGETEDAIVLGAERNELGAYAKGRAAHLNLRLAPDASPEKGYFFRSDHFPFARAGVPALYIDHGLTYRGKPEGWGQQMMDNYTATRYHAPGDEFSDDFVYEGAIQQAKLLFVVAYDVAQDTTWPNWNQASEFRAARDRMMSP